MELSRRAVRFLLLACALLIPTLACASSSEEVSDEEKAAVLNVIEWNLYYLSTEDLQGAMNTIHDDSPGRDDMWSLTQDMMRNYDIKYTILETEILSIDEDTAQVRVVQVTRKISGELPFRDNQLEMVHTLKKTADGEWKIYSTSPNEDSLEYLD